MKRHGRVRAAVLALAFGASMLWVLRPFHWPYAFVTIGGTLMFMYLMFIGEKD
jgi:hypothetical protein